MILSQFFYLLLIFTTFFGGQLYAKIHIGLMTSSNYVGDREVAWRMKIAGENLGWKVTVDEDDGRQLNYKQLDWVVCMLPYNNIASSCPIYLMVFHPFNYLNEQRRFNLRYEKYDGFLLTIHDRDTLREGLEKSNKKFHHVTFYPTVYSVPYKRLEINNLVVMIPVWGNRLSDPKFGRLYRLLSQTGFTSFYGVNSNANINPEHYMGKVPFDGKSVIDILQKHGIVLVFHSEIHNAECLPTNRIFEAAAASAVIIADQNAFVKKHFGDSVFYIDTNEPAEIIFNQIQEHLCTILQDPDKALNMAKEAHDIFIDKFTMESQLLNIQAMHKVVRKEKRKR